MILLKAFFLKGVVACAGVGPEFVTVHMFFHTYAHTHTQLCVHRRSSISQSWESPDAGRPPS